LQDPKCIIDFKFKHKGDVMTEQETIFKRFLTRKQAADYLGVKVSWLERNTKTGPPFTKKTGTVLYDRDSIDKWMMEEFEDE